MVETDTSRVVDLYMVASESTLDRRRSVVAHLEELQTSGDIDRFRIRSWPQHVVVDGPNEDLVTVVERFQRWADDAGVSFAPTLDRWAFDRSFTDESGEVISLPVVAIAVYEDDDLVEVAPHYDGPEFRSVDSALEALGALDERSVATRRKPAVDEPL